MDSKKTNLTPNKKNPKKQKVQTKKPVPRVFVRLIDTSETDKLAELKTIIETAEAGHTEIVLVVGLSDNKQAIKVPGKVEINDEMLQKLIKVFGSDNVK
jgi:hypothetical protein